MDSSIIPKLITRILFIYKYLTLCMSTATTEHPHDLYGVQKVEYKTTLHTLSCVIRLVCNMLVNVVVISLYVLACTYCL